METPALKGGRVRRRHGAGSRSIWCGRGLCYWEWFRSKMWRSTLPPASNNNSNYSVRSPRNELRRAATLLEAPPRLVRVHFNPTRLWMLKVALVVVAVLGSSEGSPLTGREYYSAPPPPILLQQSAAGVTVPPLGRTNHILLEADTGEAIEGRNTWVGMVIELCIK